MYETIMKYEIIFYSSINEEEIIVNEKFDSIRKANIWANKQEFNYNDIAIDENGNDYWETIYRYHNPENHENYTSYEVRECINQ